MNLIIANAGLLLILGTADVLRRSRDCIPFVAELFGCMQHVMHVRSSLPRFDTLFAAEYSAFFGEYL